MRCMYVCVCVVYMVLCMCYEGAGGLPWCWLACKMAPVERGGWPISTAEMSLSAHWELSQSVTDTRHGSCNISSGFGSGIQSTNVTDQAST